MPFSLAVLAPPALLLIAAALGFAQPGRIGRSPLALIELLALIAVAMAGGTMAALAFGGATTLTLAAASPALPLLAFRLDLISATMLLLVSFVGWIVVRYARVYLDGETRQGVFMAWLATTLAMVMLLVTAGSLVQLLGAWIATSLALHKLLLFYPERVAAQRAARKKFVTARAGDAALLGAALLLFNAYGTTDLPAILAAAHAGMGGYGAMTAAGLLAIAALLKSAQFPLHGWLTEVMEAPTPVSALLHAGVINAGGFLLIRFADVMLLAPGVLAVLVMVGGFTALFGGLVMLTQPAIKTSLAWSLATSR